MVWHQFEVRKHRIVRMRGQFVGEKLQDAQAGLDVQIEGAVDEFEQPGAARMPSRP